MHKNILIVVLLVVIIASGVYFGTKKVPSVAPTQVITTNTPVVVEQQLSQEKPAPLPQTHTDKNIKVYTEPDTDDDLIVGASGEQLRLIALTNFPATITYSATYSSSGAYPGAVAEERTTKNTVSVKAGKTILDIINADEGKATIQFTYLDNTGKTAAQVTPAVKLKAELYWYGIAEFPEDEITKYEISVHSSADATLTYTVTYTPEIDGESKTFTKTVPVPLGKSIVTNFMSSTTPVITYTFK